MGVEVAAGVPVGTGVGSGVSVGSGIEEGKSLNMLALNVHVPSPEISNVRVTVKEP